MSANDLHAIFLLLIIFQVKQFVADFPLQREYMLQKVRPGWDFVPPLALHCTVHAVMTLAICLWFNASLWWLAVLDFVTHFVLDRLKSGPHFLGRFNDRSKTSYWTAFGLDQMLHHLTHLAIIWILITTPR